MRLNYTRFHGDTRLVVPNGFFLKKPFMSSKERAKNN